MLPGVLSTPTPLQNRLTCLATLLRTLEQYHYDIAWLIDTPVDPADPDLLVVLRHAAANSRRLSLGIGVVPTHVLAADVINALRQLASVTDHRLTFALGPAGRIEPPHADLLDQWMAEFGQLRPTLASQTSPQSALLAGGWGLPLLSVAATTPGGFSALPSHWEMYARHAKTQGLAADRQDWSLAAPVHLAPTREQAMAEFNNAISSSTSTAINGANESWYARLVTAAPANPACPAQTLVDAGVAVIGTPSDAITLLSRLHTRTGGFGRFLQILPCWTDTDATNRSLALFADQVMPDLQR